MKQDEIKTYLQLLKLLKESLFIASETHKITVNYSEALLENIGKVSQVLEVYAHPKEITENQSEVKENATN